MGAISTASSTEILWFCMRYANLFSNSWALFGKIVSEAARPI